MVWLKETDVPVMVEDEAAAPKVAVAVMVKGVPALTTVTTPAELRWQRCGWCHCCSR